MSTTPNQKDLLAKKSDLEGILKPDDNDVLHLPDVTITLAESGQFYLAGIDKKLLTLVGNTSGNAVALDGDAGLTFTTSGGSSTITGITSSSGNSTSLAASQSMASAKQDKIVAGSNIQIAQDGKTISATDTNELENLTDVNITTPTDGQGLVYNNTTQKWENGNVSSASSIDTLTDVNLTNLTNGQILKYNSTSQEWENANESGGGGSGEGGSTFEGLDYANKTSLNIPDATGYAYTPTENGALLLTGYGSASVICESTSELLHLKPYEDTYSTVWILIEKDVTYTIKKGGGSGSSFGSGSVLYFIPLKNSSSGGGGTGGGLVEDVLWSGSYSPADTSASQLVTLNKNISNYDALVFHIGYSTNYSGDILFLTDNLTIGNYYTGTIADGAYLIAYWEYTSDTSVTLYRYSSNGLPPTYMKITGLKFGSGGGSGGSGDSFITYTKSVTTTQYGWWIVEDEDGNTLDPDTYVIIDISVNVRYYDVLWYQDPAGDYRATLFDINDGNTIRSSSTRTWTITYAKKDFAGGGGSSALSDLTDVTVTSPSDGQVLTYDNTSGKWVNDTPTASSSISTLTDVNLTSLSDGQILKYDATNQEWVNADESGGGSGTSKYTEEVLWSGNESTSRWAEPIVLNIDITDYDMLSIRCGASNETGGVHIILTSEIPSGDSSGDGTVSLGTFTDRQYSIWLNKDNNILRIFTSTDVSINVKEVVGIKYGSGGGAGGVDTLWTGDVCPYADGNTDITLDHPHTDYDYILVNTYDTNVNMHGTSIFYDLKTNYNYEDTIDSQGDVRNILLFQVLGDTSIRLKNYGQLGQCTHYTGFYGVKLGGGEGSSVTPNPSGTATDSLSSIEIDGTIYSIEGGGSGTTTEEIYKNTAGTIPDTINLTKPINDFDIILISGFRSNTPTWKISSFYVSSAINQGDVIELNDDAYYAWYTVTDLSTLTKNAVQYDVIDTIYGLKFGSGGGGDASAEEITLSDYNELTTEEKNDGTIRFIPESSVGVTTPIDMSNPTNISESSRIVIIPSEKSVEMTWDTSASSGIGATFYYSRIDVTDYDYLVYDLVTGDSYDSLHPGSENPIRDLGIGLCSSAPSTWDYAPNINWTVWNRYEVTDTNKNLGTQTLDVSELSGEYYLVIDGAAWEATISNLKYATSGGNESQIKYMDKTYGISSGGGGSGYTEEVIYSATPTTAAPSTLTLTKPYTDFDMLLFNLYRSADGVMNKYDRVVLTSKLSLNDRIQLITYNEWASYDITTATSFTLINEDRMYIGSVVGLKFGEGGGSGGSSEVTYSTTEHKVGTWIDGSTVYEKTISISNVSLSSGSYETVDTITGLDTIISCNGYAVEGNLKYTLNDITLRVIQDGTSVKLYSPSGTTWTISSGAIIIRYIKAT